MSNYPREPSPMGPKPDCRSGDLVSRLLAATPPYLYNIPVGPQNFFFSEMLRGFVHARAAAPAPPPKDSTLSLGPPPPPGSRRGRKRSWKEAKAAEPLELTTKTPPPPPRVQSPPAPPNVLPPMLPMQAELPLPPRLGPDLMINPLWFPHLYPPVPPQFDPLNFLMDLRAGAGAAWPEGKAPETKETPEEPLNLQVEDKKLEPILGFPFFKQRQSSAFRVPQPRGQPEVARASVQTKSTNYILQNLQKIYMGIKQEEEERSHKKESEPEPEPETAAPETSSEETAKGDKTKDLRALIGLELVVDYVKKGEKPKGDKSEEGCSVKDEQDQDPELSDSTDETFSHHSDMSSSHSQGLVQNSGGPYLM
nr:PREDICTED: uncharacterized protein LOC109031180 [Bemisia tabaci]